MTVASETNRSGPYNGNGSTTVFSYGFRILNAGHLRVIKRSAAGVETVLALTTHYTVAGVGAANGGSITLLSAPATGETITILRNVPFTQETDLENQGAYYAQTVEDALDLAAMRDQQIDEELARAVRLPASASADPMLPQPEARKIIAWNETATGLENLSPAELSSIVAYGTANSDIFTGNGVQTAFTLSANPAALNNLDVAIGGVTQLPGIDYTWTSGTTLTFTSAPANGVKILVRYMQALVQGGTTDDLVTSDDGASGTLWANVKGFIAYLRSSVGASIVGFVQAGAGAVVTSVTAELRNWVRPEQFGAAGDGATDDTAALQAAINSISATGGTLYLRKKYRVASNLNVPAGVNLVGDYRCPRGRPSLGSGAAPDYSAMGSSLRIASTATVTINGSSGVSGLIVYRYGMSFPATVASNASGFAGTAFTVAGDDPAFENCFIMGFNKAIYSNGAGRVRVNRCNFDNLNNIEITDCDDRCYISECHSWPFATICAGQSWTNLIRSGKDIWLHDFVDWGSVINCFSYGYQRGLVIENAHNCQAILYGADNAFDGVPLNTGSIGIELIGNCYDTKLTNCQTAASYVAGVNVNLTAGRVVNINGHSSWGINLGHGILVTSGDTIITAGSVRGAANPVSVVLAASKVLIDGMAFNDTIGSYVIKADVATSNVKIGKCNFGNFATNPVNPNIKAVTVASADPLPCVNFADEFIVSGTTSFGSLTGGYKGRRIMLYFQGALTVFNGTGSVDAIRLSGGANFTTGSGSTLYLYHNGVQWYEEGRA